MNFFVIPILLLLHIFLQTQSILVLPNGVQCPPGYVRRPGSLSCYKFYWKEVGLGVDWDFAQRQCQTDDSYGNLIIIDDPGEYEFIQYLWPVCQGEDCIKQFFWIGATNNGKWSWIDESPFPRILPWDTGYPLIDGDCAGLVYKNDRVLFVNSPCYVPFHFICEVDITPDPCLPVPPKVFLRNGPNKRDTSRYYSNDDRSALGPPVPLPNYPVPVVVPPRARTSVFASSLYLEHPFYSNKFIYCSSAKGRLVKNCPPGLFWNNQVLRCATRPFGKDIPPPPPVPLAPINPLLLSILGQRLGK